MPHRFAARVILPLATLFVGAAFGACGGETTESGGGDTNSGTTTTSDTTTSSSSDGLGVEASEPNDGAVVRMNQKIHLRFTAGAEGDYIDPATVQLLVDGEPTRIWEYYDPSLANREFRFVPLPSWLPATTHVATIRAGAAYAGDPSLALAADFTWTFSIEDAPLSEQYVAGTTPELSAAELAVIAGDSPFAETDLVKDWQDPSSLLYDVSGAVQPDAPEVVELCDKMLASLAPLGGVGLAAPQIGLGRRLFVADVNGEQRAFINPRIESYSAELYYGFSEGCLSIDGVSSSVGRPASIVVEFDTPEGDHVAGYALENFDAKVWLHEYDHLNGILQTDREEKRDW